MIIKVLGTGCSNCKKVKALAAEVIEELDLDAGVEEVTDLSIIMDYGIMATPGIVIDEEVVSSGHVPSKGQMIQLLQGAADGGVQ